MVVILDNIRAKVTSFNDSRYLVLLDGNNTIMVQQLGIIPDTDIVVRDIGSGYADDGTYYLSMAVESEESVRSIEVSATYNPKERAYAQLYDCNTYAEAGLNTYYVFNAHKQRFVKNNVVILEDQ